MGSLSLKSSTFDRRLSSLNNEQAVPTITTDNLFPNAFSQQVSDHPKNIALVGINHSGQTCRLTYEALEQQSNQLAHQLIDMGITAESRVALYLDRSTEWFVAMLAVLKSGGAFVPLDPQQPLSLIHI